MVDSPATAEAWLDALRMVSDDLGPDPGVNARLRLEPLCQCPSSTLHLDLIPKITSTY